MNIESEPAGDHLEEGGADTVILDVHQDPEADTQESQKDEIPGKA